ncbi:MAG: DNA polymerase III subunit delta [Acidobacteria bacterium RIFCSPHIGHO2_12_FULL_67_30]|nr:MAG: DNA polymerase III subunit delta [Acidobacteria bacterium RIFCSPHIGHO2_02_FULL_67_57]OFV84316.1 MAG: DNA polymerase III subunit delta [Acidobacteria bacterium RIFCSPHIGHO2_01_FULL_67_28]OFV88615.1 MAG: DNA polymerase III subunit delta [Acidobacteria bacterium RIFCSPHIGHO2_12_FULL_67_30]
MSPPRPRRSSHPVHLILGEDAYLREVLREQIISARVPAEARAMAVARFSLEETPLAEVLAQAATPALFSPAQVFILHGAEALDDEQLARLEDYLESPPEHAVLVFEADKLDRRTRAARLLLERCQVHAADSPDDSGAIQAAEEIARQHGLTLPREVAEELVFVLGTNQGRLRSELEKLGAYVGGRGEVTSADVAAVVSPARQFSVFEMADLLAERRRADALVRLRRLVETGESPVGIVGLLAWLYRQLFQARALPRGTPAWKAAQALHAPRTRVEELLRHAHKFEPDELRQGMAALLDADVALKSSPPDALAVLETLVVRLTPPRPAEAGAKG